MAHLYEINANLRSRMVLILLRYSINLMGIGGF